MRDGNFTVKFGTVVAPVARHMRDEAHGNRRTPIPERGKGRSYALASQLARSPDLPSLSAPLREALDAFTAAVQSRRSGAVSGLLTPATCARLNSRFDMDWIVSFSDAWHHWNDACLNGRIADIPLDQTLFQGQNAAAKDYHRGIARLARSQKPFVRAACRKLLKGRNLALLDLGAGFGIQARMLIQEGIVQNATCVDYPFVVNAAPRARSALRRLGGDIRTLPTDALGTFDLLWLGNLLHHYSLETNHSLLARYRACMKPQSRIVIQEYLLDANSRHNLSAAILGVHFALTTHGGRTYTTSEVTDLLNRSFGRVAMEGLVGGSVSSLIVYRVEAKGS